MTQRNKNEKKILPQKAYKNLDFLNSPAAREIRVLCEFTEPRTRLRKHNVRDTVVFYGSARTLPRSEAKRQVKEAKAYHKEHTRSIKAAKAVRTAENQLLMSRYYEDAAELAQLLTDWSIRERDRAVYVCSGGGPGITDEQFELLTLVQTGKTTKKMSIIIYGSEYWNKVLNFEPMIEMGKIDEADLDLFRFCDTPQEAFDCLKPHLAHT